MSGKQEIKISAAKGRPMLSWVGKRPLRHVTAFPAQHIETFAPVENVGANCVRPVVAGNADASTGADAKAGACDAPLQETTPAQQSFTVWRVDDYDLEIQRNEAIKLACEHIDMDLPLRSPTGAARWIA